MREAKLPTESDSIGRSPMPLWASALVLAARLDTGAGLLVALPLGLITFGVLLRPDAISHPGPLTDFGLFGGLGLAGTLLLLWGASRIRRGMERQGEGLRTGLLAAGAGGILGALPGLLAWLGEIHGSMGGVYSSGFFGACVAILGAPPLLAGALDLSLLLWLGPNARSRFDEAPHGR